MLVVKLLNTLKENGSLILLDEQYKAVEFILINLVIVVVKHLEHLSGKGASGTYSSVVVDVEQNSYGTVAWDIKVGGYSSRHMHVKQVHIIVMVDYMLTILQ